MTQQTLPSVMRRATADDRPNAELHHIHTLRTIRGSGLGPGSTSMLRGITWHHRPLFRTDRVGRE